MVMHYAALLVLDTQGKAHWVGYRSILPPINRAKQLLKRPNVKGVAIYDKKL